MKNSAGGQVVFVTSFSLSPEKRNLNAYQRVDMLSRACRLAILAVRGKTFYGCVNERVSILQSRLPGKIGLLAYILFLLIFRRRSFRPALVITEPSAVGLCGFLVKKLSNARWVVDVWDIPIRHVEAGLVHSCWLALLRRIARRLYKSADLFIVSIVPQFELKWFALDPGKLACYPNAIDLSEAREHLPGRHTKRPYILCMRSVHGRDMGLDTLCKALGILRENHCNLALEVVGLLSPDAQQQVAQVRDDPRVVFHGLVPHDQLMQLIRDAWACVVPFNNVPDLAQIHPIKVLEYLHMQKVVVAARLPGIQSMITHEVNGLLFEPGDAEDLAQQLRRLLNEPELLSRLRAGAQRLDRKHDSRAKGQLILRKLTELVPEIATHAPDSAEGGLPNVSAAEGTEGNPRQELADGAQPAETVHR